MQKSEEQYRQLVENAFDCILFMDLDGMIRFANRAALALASPVSLIGLRMRDILSPDQIKRHEELLQTRKEGVTKVYSFEWDLFRPDDHRHMVMDVRSSMLTENGKPSGVMMIARDVTDQKIRDENLRLKEVELRAVVESTGAGILAVDHTGRVILSNRRFAELWNIPPVLMGTDNDEALLTYVLDSLADPESFLEKVRKLYQTTAADHDTVLFKDGRIVERYSYPILSDGLIKGRVWSFRDVTDRSRAEKALRNSELLFKNAFSMSPMMMGIHRLGDRMFLEINQTFIQYTGYQREEVLGHTIGELGLLEPVTLEQLRKVFSAKNTIDNEEIQYRTKTGELRDGLYSAALIGDGEEKKVLGLLYDITDRKRSEVLLKLREEESRTLARSLEEANIALRVVLARRDEDQKMIEEKIQANVNDIILPFIRSLNRANMEDRDRHYLDLLESNLKSILSPFVKNVSGKYPGLTPKEMQIAEMIRQGKNSKDIAAMLGTSVATVNTHRNNIRKKLNVRKQKTNLRSHLLALV
ncbi:MAG: PAS domain S-box protein [Deltaproteobacteria bacterium]|nr:PAS domain S-box protein [Deltaproteobacteria bacterium]